MKIICRTTSYRHSNRPGYREGLMAYILGLERLGHEVYLIEEVDSRRCFDSQYKPVPFDQWEGKAAFESWMKRFGIWSRSCLLYNSGEATHGMSWAEVVRVAKSADLLLALGGQLKITEILGGIPCRAYFDGDPGITQVYHAEHGIDHGFDDYHCFFTVGLNIGTPRCDIPTCGLSWLGVLPLVVLPMWPASIDDRCERFTTISSWAGRQSFIWKEKYSGQKTDNWAKFIELPKMTTQQLEVALDIEPAHAADKAAFRENGWLLRDPRKLRTLEELRHYYASSRAEFSVAHSGFVEFNTAWFSERSVRYLALGKPVLVQSTGIEDHLPTGEGLLTFATLDEAVAGIEAINADYMTHARTARALAEEHFDSDKVLSKMLQQMGF